ncbi:MAG: hypothetical protein ABIP97_07750 [Chthoniobacterales bacterium]
MRRSVIAGMLMLFATACLAATSASSDAQATPKRLLQAIADDNFPEFVSGGTLDFLKMNKKDFDTTVKDIGPKIAAGYRLEPLGSQVEGKRVVYSWRVKFRHSGAPLTLTLAVIGSKTDGFWLK